MKEFDFLPDSYHAAIRRRRQSRRNLIWTLGLAVAMGLLHFSTESRIRTASASLTAMRQSETTGVSQRARRDALKLQCDKLQHRMDLVSQLDDDAPMDAAVGEIVRLMGDAMAMRWLSIETDAPAASTAQAAAAPEKANPAEKRDSDPVLDRGTTWVHLTGVAPNDIEVGIFFGRLTSCPLFKQVEMEFSRQIEDQGRQMREFEMKFSLRHVALGKE